LNYGGKNISRNQIRNLPMHVPFTECTCRYDDNQWLILKNVDLIAAIAARIERFVLLSVDVESRIPEQVSVVVISVAREFDLPGKAFLNPACGNDLISIP
jgi:hypothetical protein